MSDRSGARRPEGGGARERGERRAGAGVRRAGARGGSKDTYTRTKAPSRVELLN